MSNSTYISISYLDFCRFNPEYSLWHQRHLDLNFTLYQIQIGSSTFGLSKWTIWVHCYISAAAYKSIFPRSYLIISQLFCLGSLRFYGINNHIIDDVGWTGLCLPRGRSSICAIPVPMTYVIILSDNDLSPVRRKAIIWFNTDLLPIGPSGTNVSEISIKVTYHHLKCISKYRLRIGGHFVSASK